MNRSGGVFGGGRRRKAGSKRRKRWQEKGIGRRDEEVVYLGMGLVLEHLLHMASF